MPNFPLAVAILSSVIGIQSAVVGVLCYYSLGQVKISVLVIITFLFLFTIVLLVIWIASVLHRFRTLTQMLQRLEELVLQPPHMHDSCLAQFLSDMQSLRYHPRTATSRYCRSYRVNPSTQMGSLPIKIPSYFSLHLQSVLPDLVTLMRGMENLVSNRLKLVRDHQKYLIEQEIGVQLILSKKEIAAKEKQSLIRYLFHEIRVPLNAVCLSLSELTKSAPPSRWSETEIDYLTIAIEQTEAAARILNDVLSLKKVEEGGLMLEHLPFSLELLISGTIHYFHMALKDGEISLDLQLPSISQFAYNFPSEFEKLNLPNITMIGDRYRIGQILNNLLSNAIKFTPKGGTISVSVKLEETTTDCKSATQKMIENTSSPTTDSSMRLTNRNESNPPPALMHSFATVTISVIDSGAGIPLELRNNLFKPYMQILAGESQQGKGTGLGLNISKSLVELHGGHIAYQDRSDGQSGSVFVFQIHLPLQQSAALVLSDSNPLGRIYSTPIPEFSFSSIPLPVLKDKLTVNERDTPTSRNRDLRCASDTGRNTEDYADAGFDIMTGAVNIGAAFKSMQASQKLFEITNNDMKKPLLNMNLGIELNNSSYKLLVAEDSSTNRKLLIRLLTRLGYQVDGVENGQEAVDSFKIAAQNKEPIPYDLIFMDGNMPILNGIAATRQLIAMGIKIPIVAITGNAMEEDVREFLEAGAADLIAKPVNEKLLTAKLNHLLHKNRSENATMLLPKNAASD